VLSLYVSSLKVVNKDGKVKFNDFNNCRILDWNSIESRYCKFDIYITGDYRSPEVSVCFRVFNGYDELVDLASWLMLHFSPLNSGVAGSTDRRKI